MFRLQYIIRLLLGHELAQIDTKFLFFLLFILEKGANIKILIGHDIKTHTGGTKICTKTYKDYKTEG